MNDRLREIMEDYLAEYTSRVFLDDARNEYMSLSVLSSSAQESYWDVIRSRTRPEEYRAETSGRGEPARLSMRCGDSEEWVDLGYVNSVNFIYQPENSVSATSAELRRSIDDVPYFGRRYCRVETTTQSRTGWYYEMVEDLRRQDKATEKAKALFESFLNKKQAKEFRRHGKVTIKSQHGNIYEIYPRANFNVVRLEKDGKHTNLCAVPASSLPIYDQMLAQMITLKVDEDKFLKVANSGDEIWETAQRLSNWRPHIDIGRINLID